MPAADPGRGVRRRRARVSGDRPGEGARARGHRGRGRDLGAVARAVDGRGPRVRRRRRSTAFRRRLRAGRGRAIDRRGGRGAGAAAAARVRAPDVVVSDILTIAPSLAAERAGRAAGDPDPARLSRARARAAVLRLRRRCRRARAVGRALWRAALPVSARRAGARASRARTRRGPSSGWRRIRATHGGISSESWRWSRRSRSSSTRAAGRRRRRSPGRCRSRCPTRTSSCRRAMTPLVVVAPSTAKDRAAAAGPGGARGAGGRAGARAGDDQPRRAAGAADRRRPPNARRRRLARYSQVMARRRPGHLPRRPRDRRARAGRRHAGPVCCPAVGDMAENGARVAWSGAGLALPWRLLAPRRSLGRAPQAWATRRCASGRERDRRLERATTTAPSAAPSWSRGSPAGAESAREAPGVGLEPTTYRLTADRSAN